MEGLNETPMVQEFIVHDDATNSNKAIYSVQNMNKSVTTYGTNPFSSAEAQYEADIKKIDRKDRQYDTELAKFETERNAIKEEIDTLKTVAKENVDRTFKLFS